MFGIPLTTKFNHSSIKRMACCSSCPELLKCVSYALQKLQMTDITLKAEQRSATEAIYNRQDVFVWLPTGYGKSLCYQVLPFIMDYKFNIPYNRPPPLRFCAFTHPHWSHFHHWTVPLPPVHSPGLHWTTPYPHLLLVLGGEVWRNCEVRRYQLAH